MRWINSIIVGMWVALAPVAPLLAQVPDKPGPPPARNLLIAYFVAFVLLAVVCAGAMKPSKRTHLD